MRISCLIKDWIFCLITCNFSCHSSRYNYSDKCSYREVYCHLFRIKDISHLFLIIHGTISKSPRCTTSQTNSCINLSTKKHRYWKSNYTCSSKSTCCCWNYNIPHSFYRTSNIATLPLFICFIYCLAECSYRRPYQCSRYDGANSWN